MSTTDKAKELVDKFKYKILFIWYYPVTTKKELYDCAKQCALIAVDEILSLNCESFDTEPNPHHYYSKNFWNDVKEKIKQL